MAFTLVLAAACSSRASDFGEAPNGTAFPVLERIPWEIDEGFTEVWSVPMSELGIAQLEHYYPVTAVTPEVVIVGGDDGTLVGLDRHDGSVLWSSRPEPPAGSDPLLEAAGSVDELFPNGSGLVLMESWNTGWYGINPRTGETVWAERGYGVIVGRDANNFLLAGKERQHLVDPLADVERWDTRPSTPVAAISDQVAVISDETARPTVRGLDPTTGEELWSFESPVGLLTRIDVVATGDRVFIMGGEGAVVALDARTGEQVWTNTELMRAYNDDEYMSQTLAIAAADEQHLYLYVFSDAVIAINVDSGRIAWRHAVPEGNGPYVWPAADTVAISGDRGAVVLDAATGQQLAVRNGDAISPPSSDGHLVCGIFGTAGGQTLSCLEPTA